MDFLNKAVELFEFTRTIRRDLHRNPELGFREFRTAAVVAKELESLGMEVRTGVAQTGVVGLLEGGMPGPVALLRFDMDALPIQEENRSEYASRVPGVMHACGHDGHTAVGLTVARLLHSFKSELPGQVKFVFQPAEEGLGGASAMISEGVLEAPQPDFALGLHLWNERPLGWLGVCDGATMAAADVFHVKIIGKGGHAAVPNLTVDPIQAATQMIVSFQTIVSRNVSPIDAAVVSVTKLRAGEAFNVIPETAEFEGTIRTLEPEVRQQVLARFEKIIQGVADAFDCKASVNVHSISPAVINHPDVVPVVQQVAQDLFPDDPLDQNIVAMVSEDMAFFLEKVPGCYFFVGSANPAQGLDASHHHPRFDFDEQALPRAVAWMAKAAYQLLKCYQLSEKAT